MKQIIFILGCLLIFCSDLHSQASNKINFQSILRNSAGELVLNTAVSLRFQILENSNSGPIIFEETHITSTDGLGMISLKIGEGNISTGNISNIDSSIGLYFLSVGLDPNAGTNYTLLQTKRLNTIPSSNNSVSSQSALTLDYNDLTNKPTTITEEEATKIDFLEVTNPIDLNLKKGEVASNTLKTGFPGFGTTEGTAIEVLWTKMGNNAFYNGGTVGIGTNTNLDTSQVPLNINGAILFKGESAVNVNISTLDFFQFPSFEDFYFGDNNNMLNTFRSNGPINIFEDVVVQAKIGVGSSITPSYNFSNNTMAIVSPNPNILFNDTSTAASFPSADWRISINDIADGGDNYFGIDYLGTSAKSMFKISDLAPINSFNLFSNGNIGLSVETPTAKLEVGDVVTANGFIGSGSELTNIVGNGTPLSSNTGSTTIISDNDSNNVGRTIFEIKNENKMVIFPNGNVGIGESNPSVRLDVDGNLKIAQIDTQKVSINGILSQNITFETAANFQTYDATNKSIVVMSPTTSIGITGFTIAPNQKISIINAGTGVISFLSGVKLPDGTTNLILNPNETVTFIKNGSEFNLLVIDLVKN